MGRKKVELAYITNRSARKVTFQKRKKGLLKKVNEISTLCGINVCAIIYSPCNSQPDVWPSLSGVQRVLTDFGQMRKINQSKNIMDQESFLKQRITKSIDKLRKQSNDNHEKEMKQVMFQSLTGKSFEHLNVIELNDLGWLAGQHLMEVQMRRELLKKDLVAPTPTQPVATPPPPPVTETPPIAATPPPPPTTTVGEAATPVLNSEEHSVHADQNQQWDMDLMNPHIGFGWEDMILPFGDINHNVRWS